MTTSLGAESFDPASLVVVAWAYLRVRYYEAAYGYTEQRLYVQVACGVLSIALLVAVIVMTVAVVVVWEAVRAGKWLSGLW